MIAIFAVLTAAFGPLVAALTGMPIWLGLLVTAAVLFGVPLFAVHVVERFSPLWADRLCDWHMGITAWAFVVLMVVGVVGLILRWIVG